MHRDIFVLHYHHVVVEIPVTRILHHLTLSCHTIIYTILMARYTWPRNHQTMIAIRVLLVQHLHKYHSSIPVMRILHHMLASCHHTTIYISMTWHTWPWHHQMFAIRITSHEDFTSRAVLMSLHHLHF